MEPPTHSDWADGLFHDNETDCPYAAGQIKPGIFFCSKCGWSVRLPRSIVDEGEDAVLGDDFYRCPNTGEWVYKWADERLTLSGENGRGDDR